MAGILDAFRSLIGSGTRYEREIVWDPDTIRRIEGLTAEDLWRTQPYLRTVVSFVARNIAHLGVHTFERISDDNRRRTKTATVAQLLARPNPTMTTFELINATVADYKLYDTAYWVLTPDADAPSGWEIWLLPPSWIKGGIGGTIFAPEWYKVQRPGAATWTRVEAKDLLIFHGWNPGEPANGASSVEALRGLLTEQIHAQAYRTQVWQRGGRVGTVITRPATDQQWSDEARTRFARDWKAKWTGDHGPKAGGTPILEDGMELKRIGFSAKEDEWADVAKLSLAMVASVYHVNPTMVGLLDNANYSNVRQFRQMLYGDTLGPDIAMLEDRINTFLVPRISPDADVYVEFNIAEKLQGSFEEQSAALSSAVGGPWRTRNEARRLDNLPAIEGGDELIVPLNVIEGGQASPRDSAPKQAMGVIVRQIAAPVKADDPAALPDRDDHETRLAAALAAFFERQSRVVLTALGAKAAGWWDTERWDNELAADLLVVAKDATAKVGADTAKSLGFDAGDYDVGRTEAFLESVALSRAGLINSTTRDRVEELADDEDPEATPSTAFAEAVDVRAPIAAATLLTTFVAFAATEAGKQLAPAAAEKTWNVTSGNPRASHASMDGETVGIDDLFSNGMNWPGDPAGGADEVAGCMCGVTVTIP